LLQFILDKYKVKKTVPEKIANKLLANLFAKAWQRVLIMQTQP
jgi:hypothetical protein